MFLLAAQPDEKRTSSTVSKPLAKRLGPRMSRETGGDGQNETGSLVHCVGGPWTPLFHGQMLEVVAERADAVLLLLEERNKPINCDTAIL